MQPLCRIGCDWAPLQPHSESLPGKEERALQARPSFFSSIPYRLEQIGLVQTWKNHWMYPQEVPHRGLRPSTMAGNEPEIRSLRSPSLRLWLRRTGCRGLHVARSVRSGTARQSARFIKRPSAMPGRSHFRNTSELSGLDGNLTIGAPVHFIITYKKSHSFTSLPRERTL